MVNKENYSKEEINFLHYIGIYTACLVKGTFFTLILNCKKYYKKKQTLKRANKSF